MLFGRTPLRVEPFFGFRGEQQLTLTARALRSSEPVFANRSFVRRLRTMLGQYASHEVPGVSVELEYEPESATPVRHSVVTDKEGFARFELSFANPRSHATRTAWERARLRWQAESGDDAAGETTAHILAPGAAAGLGVISDIDDTIMETGITGNLRAIVRNWKRVMVQMPSERILVPGAKEFYAALCGNRDGEDLSTEEIGPQAPERPIFYVSSSPWNLFSYLVAFKRERELPLGPIMLRDWGFNRSTLGAEGHGSHKLQAIRRILEHYESLRFILVGDDTQRDLIAFAEIVARHPHRVAAVFVRSVSRQPESAEKRHARQTIEGAGIPFWTGSDYGPAREFLYQIGLAADARSVSPLAGGLPS